MYQPKQVTYFDEECQVVAKQLVLTESQTSLLMSGDACANFDCLNLLSGRTLGSIIMVPLSYVVSGTIVLSGNTLFWLEKQNNCIEQPVELD